MDKSIGLRMLGSEVVCDKITINKISTHSVNTGHVKNFKPLTTIKKN